MLSFLWAKQRPNAAAGLVRRLRLESLEPRVVPTTATLVPSKVGVVRSTASGVAVFSLDSNGNGQYDSGDSVFNFGLNSDKFLVGDWNHSGNDKIGVVRPQANGSDIFALDTNGNGTFDAGDQVFTFGLATDTVLVGDWNGDGRAKIGVVRYNVNGTATVSLDSNGDGAFGAGDAVFNFGQTGDKFIAGDWNGDGKTKLGVVRNGQGGATVILDLDETGASNPSNVVTTHFGYYSDTFVVGDWNGDGKGKLGVVRPTAAGVSIWALDSNGNSIFDATDQVFSFGMNSDTMLVGKWLPSSSVPTPLQPAPTTPATTGLITSLQGTSVAQLQPYIQAAVGNWAAAGLNAAQLQKLNNTQIQIGTLGGPVAQTLGSQITLDPTAGGLGWYLDPTPTSGGNFPLQTATGWQAYGGTVSSQGADLVTVLMHEMGHVLGLGHSTDSLDVMYASVGVGVRRMPRAQDVALIPATNSNSGTSQAEMPDHASGCTCQLCRSSL